MKVYVLNMSKAIKWMSDTSQDEKALLTTINQRWENNGENLGDVTSKEISETKAVLNEVTSGYRNELVKFLLENIFSTETDRVIRTDKDLTYTQRIAIESLLAEGLLYEKEIPDFSNNSRTKQH